MSRTEHHHRRRTRGPAPAREPRTTARERRDAIAAAGDDPADLELARVRAQLARRGPCDDGRCPGWAIFNVGEGRPSIQRCDTCAGDLIDTDDDVARLPEARGALAREVRALVADDAIDTFAWRLALRLTGGTAAEWRGLAFALTAEAVAAQGNPAELPIDLEVGDVLAMVTECERLAAAADQPIADGARVTIKPGAHVMKPGAFGLVTCAEVKRGEAAVWFDGQPRGVRFPVSQLLRVTRPEGS